MTARPDRRVRSSPRPRRWPEPRGEAAWRLGGIVDDGKARARPAPREAGEMKVVVAGGTGYIGSALLRALHQAGHETVVLTRRPPQAVSGLPSSARAVRWDATTSSARLVAALEGAGAVVNLAG